VSAEGLTLHTAAERPDLGARADDLTGEVWPEYNRHGDVMNAHWPQLDERFADFQFVLVGGAEEIVAQGHMVPCRWDGTERGLPEGIDAAMAGAFASAEPPNAAGRERALLHSRSHLRVRETTFARIARRTRHSRRRAHRA
jgi:hypothetical protein